MMEQSIDVRLVLGGGDSCCCCVWFSLFFLFLMWAKKVTAEQMHKHTNRLTNTTHAHIRYGLMVAGFISLNENVCMEPVMYVGVVR